MEPIEAKTTNEKTINLNKHLEGLESRIRGEIVTPDSNQYDGARSVYNGMIDKKPAVIVYCNNIADVRSCVDFASKHNLLISVRGGGHNGPGLALCDRGMVIDLSRMKGIWVDPKQRTVRAEAGCTWGDVDHATHSFGLATVSGIISTTGIAGLTLGGGHGYLSRKYGLTIDNLIEADIVLPDGRFVTANKNQHDDLFWALRGGGGNFGVVTAFKYRLHPVDTVVGGPMFWPINQAKNIMQWYRAFITDAPEDVYAFFLTAEVPGDPFPPKLHGQKVCGLVWCITASEEKAEPFLQQARDIKQPIFEHVDPMPYPKLQAAFDGLYPEGLQWYWKGDFIRELSDEAISRHLEFAEVPTTLSTMHMYPINGNVHDTPVEETAWNYRDVNWSMVIAGVTSDPDENDKIRNWARDYWEATHPYSAGAAYVNFLMEEGGDRIKATYGENYERLQKIKAKYDPDNSFRINQNIKPANQT